MDIVLIPETLLPKIHIGLVYFGVYLFVVMREVDIGIIPDTLIPITMADNRGPHRGTLKMIYLGWGNRNYPKQSPRLLFLST